MPPNLSLRCPCIEAGVDYFNLPLGDKVAFQIFRGDVPREPWEEEKIAVAIILKEQRRKRQAKKENEVLFSNFLKIYGSKNWEQACINLLVYIQCLAKVYCQKDLGEAVSDNLNDIAVEPCHGEVLSCLVNNLQERSLNFNQSPDFVCSDGQDGLYGLSDLMRIILNANFDDRHWEFVGFFSKRFLEGVEVSMKEACENASASFFNDFCEQHICTEGPNSARYNRFVDKMFGLGFSFDNIVGELKVHKIYFRRLKNCFEYYSPERCMSRKLIQVYFGDDRFVVLGEIDGIPVYKKRRLPGDQPWESRDGLAESDYHYIKDKRGAFVKRYTYRFIRPDERMLLSQSISRSPDFVTYPIDRDCPLSEMEAGVTNKLLVLGNQCDGNTPPPEPLDEFCLSRFGTDRYRLIATGHAAHKYDVRGNDRAEFLRSALIFHKIHPRKVPCRFIQGGGLVKIDLLKVGSDHVRCLYHSLSRVALDRVKDILTGVKESLDSDFVKANPALLARNPLEYLEEELRESKASSVRNRETHIDRLPIDAIVGWKPYPQFPFWLTCEQITPPVIFSPFDGQKKDEVCFMSYDIPLTLGLNIVDPNFFLFQNVQHRKGTAYAASRPFASTAKYSMFAEGRVCESRRAEAHYDVQHLFDMVLCSLNKIGIEKPHAHQLAIAFLVCLHPYILFVLSKAELSDFLIKIIDPIGKIISSICEETGGGLVHLNFDKFKGRVEFVIGDTDFEEDVGGLISLEVMRLNGMDQQVLDPYSPHRPMAFFMHPERTVPQDIDAQIAAAP